MYIFEGGVPWGSALSHVPRTCGSGVAALKTDNNVEDAGVGVGVYEGSSRGGITWDALLMCILWKMYGIQMCGNLEPSHGSLDRQRMIFRDSSTRVIHTHKPGDLGLLPWRCRGWRSWASRSGLPLWVGCSRDDPSCSGWTVLAASRNGVARNISRSREPLDLSLPMTTK